jgi:adenosylhomocysteine nucleosidase
MESVAHTRLVVAVVTDGPQVVAGVVFALPIEAGRFADRVDAVTTIEAAGLTVWHGSLRSHPIAWVVGGTGVARAARACRLLIDGHRPRLVISAGFAGGLNPHLARGSLIRPCRALRPGDQPADLQQSTTDAVTPGRGIVTVDEVVRGIDAKRRLAEETGADLVDMETWAVAREAGRAGLPCLGLRVVSDAAADSLPGEISQLADARSPWHRIGLAIRTVGRRPSAIGDLWGLWERAVIDSRTLADALEHDVAALPALSPPANA